MPRVTLWEHARTRKAIMVAKTNLYHTASENPIWLPLSQIEIIRQWSVEHPDGADRPKQAPLSLGIAVEIEAPTWLLEKNRITEGIEL